MNSLDWFAQILLAGVFFVDGFRRIFVCSQQTESRPSEPRGNAIAMPLGAACMIGLVEMAAAAGLIMPVPPSQSNILPMLAAAVLFILTGASLIFHVRRRQPSAPVVALFLLVLLAVIGRWA
jgi:hypothetical protein